LAAAPTNLSNHLSCRHLSTLNLAAARGELEKPLRSSPFLDDLRARGIAHEQAYLQHLRNQDLTIAEREGAEPGSREAALNQQETLAAMRAGADVIYQGTLANQSWFGRPDFLIKVPTPSNLGDWSYAVTDTKLARETRAGTILQLCVYSYVLEQLQGIRPAAMHVVTPATDFEPLAYRTDDYGAYFRLLERDFAAFVTSPAETYPELVPHCDLCAWWQRCEQRRRSDDHLCYVANISRSQIEVLRELGVNRLEELAQLAEVPKPPRGTQEALARARDQARIQWQGRQQGQPVHELREPFDAEHGLALLPEPTPDDIFLDFEGNHFAEGGVQEYLTGYVTRGEDGEPGFTALWARTAAEEKRAFEQFIDLAIDVRRRNPSAHIYHYAAYEPSALKRLMGRYATREVELDELLRGRAFVDLYTVVRRALIASVERYSIKDLEPFFGYARAQDLREASFSRRIVEEAIEAGDWDDTLEGHRQIVEDYNREDCESTARLRDWLERLRAEAIAAGHELPRPALEDGEPPAKISDLDQELQALRDALLADVPEDADDRSPAEQARFVLAHLMEFHRREDKASWWEYFRLLGLEPEDLPEERRALVGLVWEPDAETTSPRTHRYRFVPQESDVRRKDVLYTLEGDKVGTVVEVHFADWKVDIAKLLRTEDVHPTAGILHNNVPAGPLRKSLMRFAETVLKAGFADQPPYRAAQRLLLREPPPVPSGTHSLMTTDDDSVSAACRLAADLDGQVLAIQGPPGTGKTYTGGKIICALKRLGLKVGVTAVSHAVIRNLLEGALKEAKEQGLDLRALHKSDKEYEGDWPLETIDDYDELRDSLAAGAVDVVGATAWAWAREDFEQSVDVLMVDEAGQMSLANVLATAPGGRGLVLLGDPQQLEQPLQSSHPEGSEASALYHWLEGEDTMPADKGLFLPDTYRLHPRIAAFTSEVYYENRLESVPPLQHQAILPADGKAMPLSGAGLRYLPVPHTGNQAKSMEEVEVVSALVAELLAGGQWRDMEQQVRPMRIEDILIVAPYNAQVAALSAALPAHAHRIGTVDRFQGQEAPIVIYSMTSSSPDDAPRGMEFLYNSHRFNVATSRARALCILVGSPALFEPECRTPRQMKLANGFCRYLELAGG